MPDNPAMQIRFPWLDKQRKMNTDFYSRNKTRKKES